MGSSSTITKGGATTAAVAAAPPPVPDTRTSTIVVAAFNSLDATLAPAAYRCTGVNDEVEMNAALVAAAAVNGRVELLEGAYNTVLALSVAINVALVGNGFGSIINFNGGVAAVTIAGDNVKLRDFKVVIVAGAGGVGTRPNCIYATDRTNIEITKLWLIGDETVADDGDAALQSGINFHTVTYSRIALCKINDNKRQGIMLYENAHYNVVIGNTSNSNASYGIIIYLDSSNNTVTGNTCRENNNGITVYTGTFNTVTGNTCDHNSLNGIAITTNSDNCTVAGNQCSGNTRHGISVSNSDDCSLTGNTCNVNTEYGINIEASAAKNTITGNNCSVNVNHGILLHVSLNNTIVGNTCIGNDSGNTGSFDGICLEDESSYNIIHSNTCNDNDRWGISIGIVIDACVGNWVKDNHLRGNTSGAFIDNGTDTKLATKTFQFQQGGDATGILIANFINADGSAKGWEIDATNEWAIALGQMPLECQMVVRIKIWAVNLAAAGGVGVNMSLNIIANAGGSDEPYTAEAIAVIDKPSVEENMPANDVIHWMIDATDDTDIDEIQGGDSFELKANYDAGAAPDIATDAVFRAIEIEYV